MTVGLLINGSDVKQGYTGYSARHGRKKLVKVPPKATIRRCFRDAYRGYMSDELLHGQKKTKSVIICTQLASTEWHSRGWWLASRTFVAVFLATSAGDDPQITRPGSSRWHIP